MVFQKLITKLTLKVLIILKSFNVKSFVGGKAFVNKDYYLDKIIKSILYKRALIFVMNFIYLLNELL